MPMHAKALSAIEVLSFRQAVHKLQRTMGIRLTGDPVQTVQILAQRFAFNENERGGVLRHLVSGGDLSGYGLVNAVTHYSQELDDYDRATEFEAIGGKLLELGTTEWLPLAHAL